MSFLVDSDVLSEPTRPHPNARVLEWIGRHERQLFVNPVILGEIRIGILSLPRGERRRKLDDWFQAEVATMACVAFDGKCGLRWAELAADLNSRGRTMPIKDSLIAATALVHHLTIATRNVRDFAEAGVRLFNPFE